MCEREEQNNLINSDLVCDHRVAGLFSLIGNPETVEVTL